MRMEVVRWTQLGDHIPEGIGSGLGCWTRVRPTEWFRGVGVPCGDRRALSVPAAPLLPTAFPIPDAPLLLSDGREGTDPSTPASLRRRFLMGKSLPRWSALNTQAYPTLQPSHLLVIEKGPFIHITPLAAICENGVSGHAPLNSVPFVLIPIRPGQGTWGMGDGWRDCWLSNPNHNRVPLWRATA